MNRYVLLLLCALAIAGIDSSAAKADAVTIFYNGKVFTSERAHPLIEDGAWPCGATSLSGWAAAKACCNSLHLAPS